jgi:hypothetical protein
VAITTNTPLQIQSSDVTAIASTTKEVTAVITQTDTLTLIKQTPAGSAGTAVFTNGVLTSSTAPT